MDPFLRHANQARPIATHPESPMNPKDLIDYLDSVLDVQALARLDPDSLHRLENLLHHWYILTGDFRRNKLKTGAASHLDRARRAGPTLAGVAGDEHGSHLGAI